VPPMRREFKLAVLTICGSKKVLTLIKTSLLMAAQFLLSYSINGATFSKISLAFSTVDSWDSLIEPQVTKT
jgi:hypothetical protein